MTRTYDMCMKACLSFLLVPTRCPVHSFLVIDPSNRIWIGSSRFDLITSHFSSQETPLTLLAAHWKRLATCKGNPW